MEFLGSIEFIIYERLNSLIHELYPIETIKGKIRVQGEEINVNSEIIELYLYSKHHESKYFLDGKGTFIIQGNIKLTLMKSLKELYRLMRECQISGYHYNIDIYPDTEDESFEMNLRSPGYDLYMNEMNKKMTEANKA